MSDLFPHISERCFSSHKVSAHDDLVPCLSHEDAQTHRFNFIFKHVEIWESENPEPLLTGRLKEEHEARIEAELEARLDETESDATEREAARIEAIITEHQQAKSTLLGGFGPLMVRNSTIKLSNEEAPDLKQLVNDYPSFCVLQTIFALLTNKQLRFKSVDTFFTFMDVITPKRDTICIAIGKNHIPEILELDSSVQSQLQKYMSKCFKPNPVYANMIKDSWLMNDTWPTYAKEDLTKFCCIPGIPIDYAALYTLLEPYNGDYKVNIFKDNTVIEFMGNLEITPVKYDVSQSGVLVHGKHYRLRVTAAGGWRRCLIDEVIEFKGYASDKRPVVKFPDWSCT